MSEGFFLAVMLAAFGSGFGALMLFVFWVTVGMVGLLTVGGAMIKAAFWPFAVSVFLTTAWLAWPFMATP